MHLCNAEELSAGAHKVTVTAIDVNGDGSVNNRDASMISRYLVGKETF